MKKTENECVSCGLPCIHTRCPNYRVTRLYCDRCKEEQEQLYIFEGDELCKDCIIDSLEKVVTDND